MKTLVRNYDELAASEYATEESIVAQELPQMFSTEVSMREHGESVKVVGHAFHFLSTGLPSQ